jgi:hypothetical protein
MLRATGSETQKFSARTAVARPIFTRNSAKALRIPE